MLALFSRLSDRKGSVDLDPRHIDLIRKLAALPDGPRGRGRLLRLALFPETHPRGRRLCLPVQEHAGDAGHRGPGPGRGDGRDREAARVDPGPLSGRPRVSSSRRKHPERGKAMTYKFLGKTGVKVSTIAYGTMSFGGDADEAGSKALFGACRDAGVNHFDCADMYAGGRAEEILGRLIKDCREEVIITSKAYFATSKDVNAMGASRRRIQLRRRGQPAAPADRPDRYLLYPPLRRPDRPGGNAPGPRRPRPPGQGRLSRGQQLRRLAGRQGPGDLGEGGPRPVRLHPAHVQPGQAPGRVRDPAHGPVRRARRFPVQPVRRRPAQRQVRPGRAGPRPDGSSATRSTPPAMPTP